MAEQDTRHQGAEKQAGGRLGRFWRAAMATVMLGAGLATGVATSAADHAAFTGTPPVVDGFLDPVYNSTAAEVAYTQTGGNASRINGQMSVIETADAYYVGFQQSLNYKSNAYCADRQVGCYQEFRALVGSDHISFIWPGLGAGGVDLVAGVDIITQDRTSGAYAGMVQKPGNLSGEGEDPEGCANLAGLTGFSGMHWNWNDAGWGTQPEATQASPNFAGKPDAPYQYPSVAEVKFDKALCGLPDHLDLISTVLPIAHNSPNAPFTTNPSDFILCPGGATPTAEAGSDLTISLTTVRSINGGAPAPFAGQKVLVQLLTGSAGTIESVNGAAGATTGTSNAEGQVAVVLSSAVAGTAQLRGIIDLDNDGVWDQGVEPATSPPCPTEWTQAVPASIDIDKTTTTPTFTAGQPITFKLVTTASGPGTAEDVVVTDMLPGHAGLDWTIVAAGTDPGCAIAAGVLTCDYGDLAPGQVRTVNLSSPTTAATTEEVCDDAPGTVDNTGLVTTSNAGSDEDDAETMCEPPPASITIIKNALAPTFAAGENITFDIITTSTGPGTARDVVTTDALPAQPGLSWSIVAANSDPGCAIAAGTLTCNYGDLANGQSRTVRVTSPTNGLTTDDVCPEVTGRIDNTGKVTTTNAGSAEDDAVVECTPPPPGISIVKDVNSPTFAAGDPITWTIVTTSSGPGKATDVVVTDALPNHPGLAWTLTSPTDPGCAIVGFQLTCDYGDLAAGQTRTITVTSPTTAATTDDVCETVVGTVDNTAVVTTTNAGTADDDAMTQCEPPPPASIEIEKDALAASFELGQPITFDLVTTSTGPGTAKDVVVTDTLPAQAGLSWSIVDGSDPGCAIAAGVLTCTYGDLAAGQDRTVRITSPTTSATTDEVCPDGPGTIDNTGKVTTSNAGEDEDDADVECVPTASIDIDKVALAPSFTAGENITFDVVTTSTGPGVAEDVVTTDTLPAHAGLAWSIVEADSDAGCAIDAGVLTCTYGDLANGELRTVRITSPTTEATTDEVCPEATGTVDNTGVVTTSNAGTDEDDAQVECEPSDPIEVELVKDNDANVDGEFNDLEEAAAANQDVEFRAIIQNRSDVAVVITELTDVFPGTDAFDVCPELIGTVLAADDGNDGSGDDSVPCFFTVDEYSPTYEAGDLVNVAKVTVVEEDDPDNEDSDEDPSTVRTPKVLAGIDVELVKTNDADGDGNFTDSEIAAGEGLEVPFQLHIRNTSEVPVTVTELTDEFPGQDPFEVCPELIGVTLAAADTNVGSGDDEADCFFTVDGYSPPAGSQVVNTGRVTVTDEDGNETGDDDDSTVRTLPVLTVTIVKTNDADQDSTFNDSEVAGTEGQDVAFDALVTNTSAVAVTVTQLTDSVEGSTFDVCGELIGQVLQPGQSVRCQFLVEDYSPPSTASKVNTASVTVTDGNDEASASDTSIVRTGNQLGGGNTVLGNVVTPQPSPNPLPRTGSDNVPGMLELATVLLLAGIAMVWLSSRRSEAPALATVSEAIGNLRAARPQVRAAHDTLAPVQAPVRRTYSTPRFRSELH